MTPRERAEDIRKRLIIHGYRHEYLDNAGLKIIEVAIIEHIRALLAEANAIANAHSMIVRGKNAGQAWENALLYMAAALRKKALGE